MNIRKGNTINPDDVFRTMREMLLDAPPEEVNELAREAGMDAKQLAQIGRNAVARSLQQSQQSEAPAGNRVVLHKGFSSLLQMLCRRDGYDQEELARRAEVDAGEIRRIGLDPDYMPTPRTIFKLEKVFSLPSGVLAKLSGAIRQNSPSLESRALQFAANAKTMGRLTGQERELLNEFVKFLSEQR